MKRRKDRRPAKALMVSAIIAALVCMCVFSLYSLGRQKVADATVASSQSKGTGTAKLLTRIDDDNENTAVAYVSGFGEETAWQYDQETSWTVTSPEEEDTDPRTVLSDESVKTDESSNENETSADEEETTQAEPVELNVRSASIDEEFAKSIEAKDDVQEDSEVVAADGIIEEEDLQEQALMAADVPFGPHNPNVRELPELVLQIQEEPAYEEPEPVFEDEYSEPEYEELVYEEEYFEPVYEEPEYVEEYVEPAYEEPVYEEPEEIVIYDNQIVQESDYDDVQDEWFEEYEEPYYEESYYEEPDYDDVWTDDGEWVYDYDADEWVYIQDSTSYEESGNWEEDDTEYEEYEDYESYEDDGDYYEESESDEWDDDGEWVYDYDIDEWVYVEYEEDDYEEDYSYSPLGQQIVNYAMGFVGVTPYVAGGRSLYGGTDCSGFVSLIYGDFGIYCSPASLAYDGSSFGYIIGYDQARAGDIAVYGGGSHVAIYAGNGYVVHCSSPENGTVYWNMDYRSDFSWFLRVID